MLSCDQISFSNIPDMKQLSWTAEPTSRGPFTAIDDVIRLPHDLCEHLCKFGEYKYLLGYINIINTIKPCEGG